MSELKKIYHTTPKATSRISNYNFTLTKSFIAFGVKIFLWSDSDTILNYENAIRFSIKKLNIFFPKAPKSISFFLLSSRKKFLRLAGKKMILIG